MTKEFRVYYGGTLASREKLNAIEEIVVEQAIGVQWVAKIKIPAVIAEDGSWKGEKDPDYKEFSRVRVEARIGNGDFLPLIDGRIVEQAPDYDATPGRSMVTLVVHDDTNKLHREARAEAFPPGKSDSDIARSLLLDAGLGGRIEVDKTPSGTDTNGSVIQRGTMMEMLRTIAARYRMFNAYVLPGELPGTSDGCFKKLPDKPDPGLPAMFLTGPEQNIGEFRIQRNSGRAAKFEATSLSTSDKKVTSVKAGHDDAPPAFGESATGGGAEDVRVRRLPPGIGDHTDLKEAVDGAAEESGFTLSAEGSVLPMAYTAILSPYKMVSVNVSNSRYSSDYVIYRVVHTLGISDYMQSFSVRGNAVAAEGGPSISAPQPSAARAIGFNVQVDIF
jgi:hypothetical protein